MVKQVFIGLLLVLAVLSPDFCSGARVRVLVDENGVPVNSPFLVQIEVTTKEGEVVDESSFQMDGKPLEVQKTGHQVGFASQIVNGRVQQENTETQTYRIRLPGQPEGVHVLTPISVMVGKERVSSQQTTYSVIVPDEYDDFTLEAKVQAPDVIYPGQEVEFQYILKAPLDLEVVGESLPLLSPEGFMRLGDPENVQKKTNTQNIWEVRQRAQAVDPGIHHLDSSYFEGVVVRYTFFGQRQILSKRARARTPGFDVTIEPFPTQGQPASFSGALGDFQISAKLLSPNTVGVGDRLNLLITVQGQGNLTNLTLPKLDKQPGFEHFRIGDLPDGAKLARDSKLFSVDLRPLDESVTEIPAVSFSFLDPSKGGYNTVRTEPIPITVKPLAQPTEGAPQTPSQNQLPALAGRIPIAGNFPLASSDLTPTQTDSSVIYLVPLIGILAIIAQLLLKRSLAASSIRRRRTNGKNQMQQALKSGGVVGLNLAQKALLLRLHECGHTQQLVSDARPLPSSGKAGEVRNFLIRVEAERFAGNQSVNPDRLLMEAKQLFDTL